MGQFMFVWIETMVWAVIARALISWFPIDQSSPIIQVLFRVTEPIIEPFRRVLPNMGMVDLSPLAAVFGLIVLQISLQGLVDTG